MAILDFRPRGDVLTGLAVGVGVLAVPVVLPLAWSAVRPLVKGIMKGGFLLYETGRGAIAGASEWVGREEPEMRKELKAVAPVKVTKPEKHIAAVPEKEAAARKEDISEHRTEHVGKIAAKESPKKPSHAKPKRQAKTTRKKPEKEQI